LVVSAFFEALQPAQLDVLAEGQASRQREHERLAQWQREPGGACALRGRACAAPL
jgi:hypothetical protein